MCYPRWLDEYNGVLVHILCKVKERGNSLLCTVKKRDYEGKCSKICNVQNRTFFEYLNYEIDEKLCNVIIKK